MYNDQDLEEALRQKYRNRAMDMGDDRIAGLDLSRVNVPERAEDLVSALYRGAEGAPSIPDELSADDRASQGWKDIGMALLSDKSPAPGDDSIQESWDIMDVFPPEGMASMGAAGAKALAAKGMALKGAGMMAPALAAGEIRGVIQGGKSVAPTMEDALSSLMKTKNSASEQYTTKVVPRPGIGYDVIALDKQGNRVGWASFKSEGDTLIPLQMHVDDEHQRKGVATRMMQDMADNTKGWYKSDDYAPDWRVVRPEKDALTSEGSAFWDSLGSEVRPTPQEMPPDMDRVWRELQGIPDEAPTSAADKLKERGANVRKLPVRDERAVLSEPKTAYDTIKRHITENLPARFGDNPPKGGFVYKTPVSKGKKGEVIIDTYGRGDVHNAQFTLDGTPKSKVKGWNEPQPFPADPDDIRGNIPAKGTPIVIGAKSDPFMWMDSKYKGSQALLEDLFQYPNVTLNTRSDLIARDDYIALLQGLDKPTINIHVPKLGLGDEADYASGVTRQLQPGAPSIKRRVLAYKKLKDAGFNVNLVPETKLGKMPGTSKAVQPASDLEYRALINKYLKSDY